MQHKKMWWLYTIVTMCLINLTTGDEPKIVIIGAGAAGIAAASKLYENGFQDVTIFEAENRIGGRVNTTWFDQSWIDLGGQWINGQTNNIAYDLASPLGLVDVPDKPELYLVYNSDGYQIPNSISYEFFQLYSNVSKMFVQNLQGNNNSFGDYFTGMLTSRATKIPAANESLIKQFVELCEGYQNLLDGSDDWCDISARGKIEYWKCPGSFTVNWKNRGYATILDILMKELPNPENKLPVRNNTILNCEVVNIDYNSTEGKVLLELSNGEKYTADHVIVTPSLGVLKEQYETLFTPQLPELKIKTIKGLSMGTMAKIYISFETAWWPDNVSGSAFVWNESDRQEYENDPDKKWLLDFLGFITIPNRPRILLGWMLGSGARDMEKLPEEQVLNQTLALLRKFVGNSYNVTKPTGFLRSKWYSNKNFRGTSSFRSMKSEKADVWAYDLAAPLLVNGKPLVMFGGEATNAHHPASVHGAIETGFREANRLIEIYKNT